MQAAQFEHLAQILNDRKQAAVAGQFLNPEMEFLVGFEKSIDAAVAGCCFEAFVDVVQRLDIARRGAAHGITGTAALKQGHQRKDVVEILARNFDHVATAARLEVDQTFGSQHLERFAQRRARDSVLICQFLLVDPVARLQFVGKNSLAQAFRHFLIECGRCNSGHGFSVVNADRPILCRLASIIMDTVLCRTWYVKASTEA